MTKICTTYSTTDVSNGVERRRTATATGLYDSFCPILFLFTQFLITFICVSRKIKRRGKRRQLPRSCLNVATGLTLLTKNIRKYRGTFENAGSGCQRAGPEQGVTLDQTPS